MTAGFIKQITAWRCPLHQAVLVEAGNALQQHGYVNKEQVIQHLKLEAVQSALRWDYIVEFLGDPSGVWNISVLPVAQRFFKERDKILKASPSEDVEIDGNTIPGHQVAGRYLAVGHGKKTAGYIRATLSGGRFLLWHVDHMRDMSNGLRKSAGNVLIRTKGDPEIEADIRSKLPKTDVSGLIKLLAATKA